MITLSSWKTKPKTQATEDKRKKTYKATMTKKKIKTARERGSWYCQADGSKHYKGEPRFVVCRKCFRKIKGVGTSLKAKE